MFLLWHHHSYRQDVEYMQQQLLERLDLTSEAGLQDMEYQLMLRDQCLTESF